MTSQTYYYGDDDRFTVDNTDGYNRTDLEILNVAYDLSIGVAKVGVDREIWPDLRKTIAERTLAQYDAGEHDADALARFVLRSIGIETTDRLTFDGYPERA